MFPYSRFTSTILFYLLLIISLLPFIRYYKIWSMATATPRIFYYSNDFSIFHFCPFKSFCFSYRLLCSLQSSFIRSNCALTPSRQSGSIFLYSPVRLRIVLLFSFICSDKQTQSIRFCTSLSVSYRSVSATILAHSRTMTFFSISVIPNQSSLSYRLISKARFERLFALSACSNAFDRSTINCTCSLPK